MRPVLTGLGLILLAAAQTRVHGPSQVRQLASSGTVTWYQAGLPAMTIPAGQCIEVAFSAPGASPGIPVAPAWPASLPSAVTGLMFAADGVVVIRMCSASTTSTPSAVYGAALMTWR